MGKHLIWASHTAFVYSFLFVALLHCIYGTCPVALTPFWWSALRNWFSSTWKNNISASLDPHMYAFRTSRPTSPLPSARSSHILKKTTTPGPAFNTISPMKLIGKLHTLGLSTTLGNWILDFLTNRPQTVGIGSHTSFTLMLNAGAPQGGVFRPLQFTMYTHNRNPRHGGNCVVKFVDKNIFIGCITNSDRRKIRKKQSCKVVHRKNTTLPTVSKSKEVLLAHHHPASNKELIYHSFT